MELINKLENDELELPNAGAEFYTKLLALYLQQNKLNDAKHLWKRIPPSLRTESEELGRMRLLLCALLMNDTSEFFKNINYTWSDSIKDIMADLSTITQRNVFTLVGTAYNSIFEEILMNMTLMSREQLKDACQSLDWTYETDGQQTIIFPKRPAMPKQQCDSSEDQLLKLTDFVSFLEN